MPSRLNALKPLIHGKVVAVVRLDSGEQLVDVAEALGTGGILEFTVSTLIGSYTPHRRVYPRSDRMGGALAAQSVVQALQTGEPIY